MSESGLTLERFGVAFGDRQVLADLTLRFPARGMCVLVGPVASGKSTLLRTLAGLNHAQPELLLCGRAEWNGRALFGEPEGGGRPRISLMMQKARFFVDTVRENLVSALPNRASLDKPSQDALVHRLLEECQLEDLRGLLEREVVQLSAAVQRHLALARAIASQPDVLLADEPTAGVEDAEAEAILRTLEREAERRCVILVTHRQHHARRAGGTTYLLVDGSIRESAPTGTFFEKPPSELSRTFLRTGGCLQARLPSDPLPASTRSWSWPRGFFWVEPGAFGGLPRPGLLTELEQDLLGLTQLGVRVVVGLEETATVPARNFITRGLDFIHFPVRDMDAPELEPTKALCRFVLECVRASKPVAFHCRAGLGRTGTLLAACLVARGSSASQAIETVRAINPLCIQAQTQIEFLKRFAAALCVS